MTVCSCDECESLVLITDNYIFGFNHHRHHPFRHHHLHDDDDDGGDALAHRNDNDDGAIHAFDGIYVALVAQILLQPSFLEISP